MGLFDKKKKAELPLPPPPPRQPESLPPPPEPVPDLPEALPEPEDIPTELPPPPIGDFEPIRAPDEFPPVETRPFPVPMKEEEVIEPPRVPSKSFVAVEDFKSIVDNSNRVRAKIMEAEELVKHLSDIKSEEERLFERWRGSLEQIEKKLNHVDKVIEKAQR